MKLRKQLRVGAVVGAPVLGVEPEESGVPPVAQDGAKDVLSLREQRRDVVSLVLEAPVVVCPAGGEHVFSDLLAVYGELVDAAGGRVQARLADRSVERKRLAKVRARGKAVGEFVVLVSGRRLEVFVGTGAERDPVALPVGPFQKSRLEDGQPAVRRWVAFPVPDTHLPHAARARSQRLTLV